MSFWVNVLVIVHVLVALAIIGLVLLQHGKGADMGSGFGGGASSSLFGATGSANFLSRATAVLATVFFLLSLALAYIATNAPRDSGSIVDRIQSGAKPAASEKAGEKPTEKKEAAPAGSAGEKRAPAAGESAKDKNVPQ
jgi:preprotein translocase subunit SecG